VRTIVKGKNIDVPDSVRRYAERKMRRLERFLDDRSEAVVELSSEQHRSAADSQIVEVTLVIDGRPLRSHAAGPTHQAALDAVVDRIERQAVDFRRKPRDRARWPASRARRFAGAALELPVRVASAAGRAVTRMAPPEETAGRSRIVKTKRFALEPMFEEDAVARMEELGHQFFIFVNAESERLCVLYRRRAGDFGLIEPILGGQYTPGRDRDGRAGGEPGAAHREPGAAHREPGAARADRGGRMAG
jgi:putative sigma-54 modulation protein